MATNDEAPKQKPGRKRGKRRPLASLYASLETRVGLAKQILRGADPENTADTGTRIKIALDVLADAEPMGGTHDDRA